MSVTEVRHALGSWSLSLRAETPADVLDAVTPFGHIAILPGRMTAGDIQAAGDSLLTAARYVGVYRGREAGGEDGRTTLRGAGMAFWLGDEDSKGYVYETALSASGTFSAIVTAALAPVSSVQVGTLTAVAGDGGAGAFRFIYQTPRDALTYLADTYSSSTAPVGWRVNGNGTVDAGPESALYRTSPVAMLVAKDEAEGRDLAVIGMRGQLGLENDLTDYTTRVVLLAEGEEGATASGSASLSSVPYNDLFGNDVRFTRLVSESDTSGANALVRATLQLNRFSGPRYAVTLDTSAYDVKGEFVVGDTIMIYDPATGFSDPTREVLYRGLVVNPMHVQVTEMTWPVHDGWTVAYRDGAGAWFDLSPFYVPESGATTVVVGQFSRDILASSYEQVGSRPLPDSSVPAAPVFGDAFTSTYQSGAANGETRGQVQLSWSLPLNVDGSTVTDGAFYELRYRPNVTAPYPATHDEMSTRTHDELETHDQPLISPITDVSWHYQLVPWGTNQVIIQELTPGVTYEFEVRATDAATPPNRSAWSSGLAVDVALDFFPPAQPAAPEVAGSSIAIQVIHRLGRADGGTFNLDVDLDHLEIHVSGGPGFFPDESTYVGKLVANRGLLLSGTPAVGTFPIDQVDEVHVKVVAVDRTGNRSGASPAATVTAVLIDNAHISDLSVTKVTAGTISAQWILGSVIWTAPTGARAVMSSTNGFYTYNSDEVLTFWADASTGNVQMVGQLSSGTDDQRIVVNPFGSSVPAIRFYPAAGGDYAVIYGAETELSGNLESWLYLRSSTDVNNEGAKIQLSPEQFRAGMVDSDNNEFVGGGIYADTLQALVGHFPANDLVAGFSANDTFMTLGTFDAGGGTVAGLAFSSAEDIIFTGQFFDNNSYSNAADDAVIAGHIPQGAAALTFTRNYGVTSAGTLKITATWHSATNTNWRVSTNNNVGFVFTVVTSSAGAINYWGYRLEP